MRIKTFKSNKEFFASFLKTHSTLCGSYPCRSACIKNPIVLTLFPLLMSTWVLTGSVLYIDAHHLPAHNDVPVAVIYLDGPRQLQVQLFGELSSNQNAAQRQTQAVQ